jgi:hypothetical protein
VGQIGNLRRIVNPPAALGRARRDRGESPTPFAACRYAGQDGILRRVYQQAYDPMSENTNPILSKPVVQSGRRQQAVNDRERSSYHLRLGAKQSPPIRNRLINA